MKRWMIGAEGPDRAQIEEISGLLRKGEIVVLPTDTIYGLHGLALDPRSVNRLFRIKGRASEKALPVLFADLDQARAAGVDLTPEQEASLAKIWPAPLTAILELNRPIPATAGMRSIAARIPDLPWLRELISRSGPLASTSANRSGESPALNPSSLPSSLKHETAGIVDAGVLLGKASTIVDFTTDPPKVVRQGEFFFTQNLWKKVRKTL